RRAGSRRRGGRTSVETRRCVGSGSRAPIVAWTPPALSLIRPIGRIGPIGRNRSGLGAGLWYNYLLSVDFERSTPSDVPPSRLPYRPRLRSSCGRHLAASRRRRRGPDAAPRRFVFAGGTRGIGRLSDGGAGPPEPGCPRGRGRAPARPAAPRR